VSATTYQGRIFFRDTLDSAPARLVVARPPAYAEIRRRDDVSGTVAGVAGRPLEVECVAHGGSPAPTILWHLAGVAVGPEEAVEAAPDPDTGLAVTVSRVRLPALRRAQDGQELSCEVLHPGLHLPLWVKAMLNIGCKWV
jgi:hypothetical protein